MHYPTKGAYAYCYMGKVFLCFLKMIIFILALGKQKDSYHRWSDINTNTYPQCAEMEEFVQILISHQNSPWLSKLGPCLGSYQGTLVQAVTSSWGEVVEHQLIFKQTCNFLVFRLAGTEGKPEVILDVTWLQIYPLLHAKVTDCVWAVNMSLSFCCRSSSGVSL